MTATYGASVTKKLRISLISIFVALAVPLVGVIGVAYLINGEEVCLDRHPWWGPPESGNDDSCSGHIRAEASGIALARQEEKSPGSWGTVPGSQAARRSGRR